MSAGQALQHQFVDIMPDTLDEDVLYISIRFATAIHLCCCGCRHEVVTPLSPTDWSLTFDGESVSLRPSIGNWSFSCQSHYWITHNQVRWARAWNWKEIAAGRMADKVAKARQFAPAEPSPRAEVDIAKQPWRLKNLLNRLQYLIVGRRDP